MKDMQELMLHFLQDIYYAERLNIRAMAKALKAAENQELKQAIEEHREQSQRQVERLGEVFAALGKKPRAKTCAAMDGLVEETNEAIQEGEKGPVLDAALTACQQAVEHYEIARYGAMASWARTMGLEDAAGILEEILQEEKDADQRLTEIAERALNPQANEEEGEEGGEEEEEEPEEEPEEEKPAPKRKPAARAKK